MIVAFFQVLFTEQISESTHQYLVKFYRYSWRADDVRVLHAQRQPEVRPGGHGVRPRRRPRALSIPRAQHLTRWGPLYKWILAIPALIVLWFYAIGAMFFLMIAWFQVLFTGTWSQNGRDFVVKVQRQTIRVNAYLLLTDEKPPTSPE